MSIPQVQLVKISCADWNHPEILKNKLTVACRQGVFFQEIPQECRPFIERAVNFGNAFYKDEKYTTLHLEGFSGYHDRDKFQVESIYLKDNYWSEKLPGDLAELAQKMRELGTNILKQTLRHCDIAEQDWDSASGGVAVGKGQTHFTFNHYRQEKPKEAMAAHRDFGQITVLFINKKGLQARINNVWTEVLPQENHFVINYGRALETLVNDAHKLTAVVHRVPQLQEDRISFGIFSDNDDDSTLFTREEGTLKDTGQSYKQYLQKMFTLYD